MSSQALATPYRPGGWTVRQVINHLADSHMNAYVRMKLTVTEPTPIIKPYEEALWAETEDGKGGSVKNTLRLLSALHQRWVQFLESLSEEDLERGYFHPERQSVILLPEAIALYAWHSKHHLAHIGLVASGKAASDTMVPSVGARRGRPKASSMADQPKLSRAEILAKARAARAAKLSEQAPAKPARAKTAKKTADQPKLSRAEILAKARAARAAKKADQAPAKTAKPKTAKKTADQPKLSRAEILANARAARAAKKADQAPAKTAKPKTAKKTADQPKRSRAEILANARAVRAAKKADQAPAKTAEPKTAKKAAGQPTPAHTAAPKTRAARGKKKA